MTEEENKKAFDDCMDFIQDMKPSEWMEWWRVENTGWSNGTSWFPTTRGQDICRFESHADALRHIVANRYEGHPVKWRIVHVTLERLENKSITTEVWEEI